MRLHIDSARQLGTIVVVVLVTALAALGCGDKKGPDIVSPSETYIPDFNRTWRNAANAGNIFFFNPNTTGVTSGTLAEGSNERLTEGGLPNAITGTFNGRTLTFRIARPTGAVDVTGRFVTNDQIQLTFPGNQTVTLNRDPE
jgi:hypothetical protein